MWNENLIEYGEYIGYGLAGLIALVGLGVIQLIRRRGDLKRARVAVRLASYSIVDPRVGPTAVKGTYRQTENKRWLENRGERVVLDDTVEVVRGTSARWQSGTRTYAVKPGDEAIAIGVMSKTAAAWRLVKSPGEAGIQLFAVKPRPAPPPLFPWRAPLFLALCGAIGFFGLYGAGTIVVDVPRADACNETSQLRLQIAAALPQVRDEALARLDRCHVAR